MKNSLMENLSQDYVRTAFAKGLSEKRVIFFHAVRNSLIPLATGIGSAIGVVLAGSYLIEKTFGIDPELIKEKITSSTKAIIPMDYGGMSCQISEIKEYAENNNLLLIEDAAESLGSSVNGKKIGSMADATVFSFCGNKVLTTGEGGAVVTNSRDTYEKIKLIRSHGRLDQTNYFENPSSSQYLDLGYNWRMSSITAALGISQLNKLEKIIQMRKDNANYISSKLSKFSQIKVPTPPNDYDHIYQMYTIRLPDKDIRDSLHDFLSTRGIFSKVYFTPIHSTLFYKQKFDIDRNSLSVTEKISNQILTLPLYPNMTMEEKDLLIQTVSEFFE